MGLGLGVKQGLAVANEGGIRNSGCTDTIAGKIMLALRRPEALIVVSLELEELLEMRLAVHKAIQAGVAARCAALVALSTPEAPLVQKQPIDNEALHVVHGLGARHTFALRNELLRL